MAFQPLSAAVSAFFTQPEAKTGFDATGMSDQTGYQINYRDEKREVAHRKRMKAKQRGDFDNGENETHELLVFFCLA